MTPELHCYQWAGVRWLRTRSAYGSLHKLLGDGPGVGKCAQVLTAAGELRRRGDTMVGGADVLVVCPKSVVKTWRDEIALWRPDLRVVDTLSLRMRGDRETWPMWTTADDPDGLGPVVAVVWPQALDHAWMVRGWRSARPFVVVVDEPHEHRSFHSEWVKRISSWTRFADAVWGLTGTPIYNVPADMEIVLGLLRCGVSRSEFSLWSGTGVLRTRLVERGVLLSRTLADVAGELRLPPLSRSVISSALPDACTESMEWRRAQNAASLRRIAGWWKWDLVHRMVKAGKLHRSEPTLLWYVHKDAARQCAGYLREAGVAVECVTGATSDSKRAAVFGAFQRGGDGDPTWLVLTQCAQAGVQLQRARCTVTCEIPWQTKAQSQAVARMWRQGQTHPTREFTLAWLHDVDMHVLTACEAKNDAVSSLGF